MALHEYLVGEVAQDWSDGLVSRREALRRLGLLGLSLPAGVALLAGCGSERDTASSTGTTSTTGAPAVTPTSTPGATTDTSGTEAAGTEPSTSEPSATGQASDSGAASGLVEPISFPGPAGPLLGFYAQAADSRGAVLVVHENRGLTEHFEELPARFAASGYSALAVDLVSRQGGTESFADPGQVTAALGSSSEDDLLADLRAALDELARRQPDQRLAVVGFCFGGGQVWNLLEAGEPRLAAAVPFYGPGPDEPDFSGSTAAVLGVYAELDGRVNASMEAMEAELSAAGLSYEMRVFGGVDHAFFNDTGPRYDATQAEAAYEATIEWFDQYLAS